MITHTFNQIAAHTWWLSADSTTDRPTLGAICGSKGTLLVDTGNSPAHAQTLLNELQKHNLPAPIMVALTHWHWDHVFGSSVFDLPTFAHNETKRIVSIMANLDWSDAALDQRVANGTEVAFCRDHMQLELPDRSELVIRPPDIGFETSVEIDLGGVTCRIEHVGGDHSADSSIIHIVEDKIVFLGDCIYHDLYHGPDRYTLGEVVPLFDRLLALDAAFYLAGHHDAPLSHSDMLAEADLLKTIGRLVTNHYPDRESITILLAERFATAQDEDHIEIADAFIAGLLLTQANPIL
jgi:glyoxylase-like metal-dependent hydrolase (beta-lactamase superfamily II)